MSDFTYDRNVIMDTPQSGDYAIITITTVVFLSWQTLSHAHAQRMNAIPMYVNHFQTKRTRFVQTIDAFDFLIQTARQQHFHDTHSKRTHESGTYTTGGVCNCITG